MNTEFYNKLKANDAKEKEWSSLGKLRDITNKKLAKAKGDEIYALITTFYSYVKENYEKYAEQYKESFAPWIAKYYTKEKIEEKFNYLMSDEKYLDIILDLGGASLYSDLMQVAYDKAKNGDLTDFDNYTKLRRKAPSMGFSINDFRDIEVEKAKGQYSSEFSSDSILEKSEEFDKIVDAKPLETPVLDNSNINEYEKIANSAMDKINKLVSERNIELPKEDKNEEKKVEPKENSDSYDFSKFDDNYNSIKSMNDNIAKKEQELIEKQNEIDMERKRVEHLEQRRENEMVLNASDDLGISEKNLNNVISKSGIDLKDVDKIIISKEMLDSVANGYVASLSNNKFNNFLENVARSNKLKKADFTVENLNGINILKINSNDAISKIASCEQKLFKKISDKASKKASLKNRIINLTDKTKENIISTINFVRTKVSDKLYQMAGKISSNDYGLYSNDFSTNNFNGKNDDEKEIIGKIDDVNKKNQNDVEDIIKKLDEERNSKKEQEVTSILDEVNERRDHSESKKVDDRELNEILDKLKNNKTYASSGTYVGNTESKMEEEIHKSM